MVFDFLSLLMVVDAKGPAPSRLSIFSILTPQPQTSKVQQSAPATVFPIHEDANSKAFNITHTPPTIHSELQKQNQDQIPMPKKAAPKPRCVADPHNRTLVCSGMASRAAESMAAAASAACTHGTVRAALLAAGGQLHLSLPSQSCQKQC